RSTARDRRGEVGGERDVDGDGWSAERVREAEVRAVEREAMEPVVRTKDAVVLALAVADVADERTRDVLQVPADLVEASGARVRLDERVAAERVAPPDLGD